MADYIYTGHDSPDIPPTWEPYTAPFSTAFGAGISALLSNVTGAGTIYTIPFDEEYYDVGGDFDNTTGIYTAPHDGGYQFNCTVTISNLSALMTRGRISLLISGTGPCVGTWPLVRNNPYAVEDTLVTGVWRFSGSHSVLLDANDTVACIVEVDGGAGDTAALEHGSLPISGTLFTGFNIS